MEPKQCTKNQKSWLEHESGEWVEQGIINQQQQTQILNRYSTSHVENFYSSWSSLLLISLGAILIGGGIILLIAHNWEYFGKGTRTILSILPLLLAQALAWYSIRHKPQLTGLREAAGILLFFAVAASIALISQTYHIHGDLERFLVTWLLLGIPILYLLSSAGTLMLVCALILWLCGMEREPYWLYYLVLAPYLYSLYTQQRFVLFQWALWFVVIGGTFSIVYSVSWKSPLENWMPYIALTLFVFYYCLGKWLLGSREHGFWANPFSSAGALGIASITLMLTWDNWYKYSRIRENAEYAFNDYLIMAVFVVCVLGVVAYVIKRLKNIDVVQWALVASLVLALLGLIGFRINMFDAIYMTLANVYILIASVIIMSQGINQHRLMLLNGGLLWFSLLVLFRFFDSDIPFALKGIVFILIGFAFLGVNIWYNKKLKQQQPEQPEDIA